MNKMKLFTTFIIVALAFGISGYTKASDNVMDAIQTINRINNTISTKAITYQPQTNNSGKSFLSVSPLAIVNQPGFYVGKNVKFKAKFDKFSTLGLDYKPAFRSSEKYITILIQRPDITSHDIPLSELKIFIDRETAEKYIDLNSGDEIEISGTVFSKALGDAWMNADVFNVLKTTPKTDKK